MSNCKECIFRNISVVSYYPKIEYKCDAHYNYRKITSDKNYCFDYGCKEYKEKESENENINFSN